MFIDELKTSRHLASEILSQPCFITGGYSSPIHVTILHVKIQAMVRDWPMPMPATAQRKSRGKPKENTNLTINGRHMVANGCVKHPTTGVLWFGLPHYPTNGSRAPILNLLLNQAFNTEPRRVTTLWPIPSESKIAKISPSEKGHVVVVQAPSKMKGNWNHPKYYPCIMVYI